ncbi:hypothetical protein TNCT_82071 [Trichonephila clavata]|uniref:Uncharacterized protein n=1 Tax=Trichonephila clavata TaxID=2740835 RepID=A0A8X6L241_TRICU|nr:hypothetical protein TNCT_82071 [Trichonephila clavata]
MPASQSLESGPITKRRSSGSSNQESWRAEDQTSKVESRKKPEAWRRKTSPCPLRSRVGATESQELPAETSPYRLESRAETRRSSSSTSQRNRSRPYELHGGKNSTAGFASEEEKRFTIEQSPPKIRPR